MVVDFVLIFGMIIFVMIAIFILKKKNPSKILLLPFVFYGFLNCIYNYAAFHNIDWIIPYTLLFTIAGGLYLGPFTYLYTKSYYSPKSNSKKEILKLLIPYFIVWTLYALPYNLSLILNDFTILKQVYNFSIRKVIIFYMYLETFVLLYYLVKSFNLLKKIKISIEQLFSNNSFDFKWLHNFLIFGVISNIILLIVLSYFVINANIKNAIYYEFFFTLLNILIFSYFIYRGVFQSHILLPNISDLDTKIDDLEKIYKKNDNVFTNNTIHYSISDDEIERLKAEVEYLMNEQKIYKNPEFNLRDLAILLDISNNKLTTFINQILETNFQNLINYYRIEEFKNRIANEEHKKLTIMAIAIESGFNSKSSFNRIFKKFEGCTPSKYIERLEIKYI